MLHELGRGGMATVYCVQHQLLGTRHALKVLHDPAAGERLLREGRVQARLDPAHVVPVTDVLEVGGTHALVMPLVEGCSLAEVLAEHRLSEAEVAALFTQICAGVRAAHDAAVMHRDLKPANVLLEVKHGRVVARVADFGLARAEHDLGMTQTGAFLGTPAYASPEQLAGGTVDAQADLWALGVLLFELLTGSRPFPDSSFGELFAAVHAGEVDDSAVPEAWRPVVAGLLSRVGPRRLLDLPVEARPLAMGTPVAEIVRIRVEAAATAVADTPTQAVAPTSSPAVPHSLPRERDAFVGRDLDLDTLETLLRDGAALVSVLGIGGTGKTRLVLHYGWTHLTDWPGGVWFCDLSEARSVDGIVHAVGSALDAPLGKGDPIVRLGHAIAGRGRCLVFLDNFEQVARHADQTLGHWLDRASEARFVVTTREVLGLPGETALPLAPLNNPEGVELFVTRARQAKPDFDLADDAETVTELVRLLDGLPLAIELAAARSRVMPPEKLLSRLGQRFRLLTSTGARRDRQATLRGALDWSWDLLSAEEQSILAQLSVFEGGFTLDAAEAVLALEELWAEDAVQALVDKSLVRVVADGRFDLLVSVQEYATEKLDALNTTEAAQRRHGEYFAEFGSDAAWAARAADAVVMRRSWQDLDNVLVACRRAVQRGDADVAVPTLGATWTLLRMTGPISVFPALGEAVVAMPLVGRARSAARRCLAIGLSAAGRVADARARFVEAREAAADDPLETARVDKDLGFLLLRIGEPEAAARHLESAAAAARELAHPRVEAHALANLGLTYDELGDVERARAAHESALRLRRATRDRYGEGVVLSNLGDFEVRKGRIEAGRSALEQALVIAQEVGNGTSQGHVRVSLGNLAWEEGHLARAETHYRTALTIHRDSGHRYGEVTALGNLAALLAQLERTEEAVAGLQACLEIARQLGSGPLEGQLLENLGTLYLDAGRLDEARTHYEQALAILRGVAMPVLTGPVLGGLGLTLSRLGRMREAREAFDEGGALLAPTGEQSAIGELWAQRALFEVLAGHQAAARDALARAEELADALGVGTDSPLARQIDKARAELAARTT